jgi:hypothetical protein
VKRMVGIQGVKEEWTDATLVIERYVRASKQNK